MEIQVDVDLAAQRITLTIKGETLEAPLTRRLDAIAWAGVCLTGVTTDFSPMEIGGR